MFDVIGIKLHETAPDCPEELLTRIISGDISPEDLLIDFRGELQWLCDDVDSN